VFAGKVSKFAEETFEGIRKRLNLATFQSDHRAARPREATMMGPMLPPLSTIQPFFVAAAGLDGSGNLLPEMALFEPEVALWKTGVCGTIPTRTGSGFIAL